TAVNGDACNWSSNWGVDLGFDTTNPRGPWGSAAPTMLAVSYAGTPGTYNLLAHLTGDPDSQWYGIPNYASGQFVTASALRLQYWTVPPSTALSGFQNVDMLAVFLDAEPTNVTYDFCVTGISTR
ncbi:MAG: hypothetical protein M3O46_13310, partial [Myxococcota bacterium]|nr:hypothetical protein [Myxococcota bacterium]